MGNFGSILGALLQGSAAGFVEAEQEDKLKQEKEKLAVKERRFEMARLVFKDENATPEAKRLSLEVIGGKGTGKAAANFDQFVALGSMEVPTEGGDAGSALPRGRPVALQGPPDQLNQEGNINRDAQAGITEGGPDVGAQLEEGLRQQPPSDFAELEQPPTGPTQEALDRQVQIEPGTKEVGLFKTGIEQIEEQFRATEKVRELNTQAALRDASVFLQQLPPGIPMEDKQSFFSIVRQNGDVIGTAEALGFPMTVAQRKAFKDQALNSTRTEATNAFVANPTIGKDQFKARYAGVLGDEPAAALHTQLVQAEAQREANVEEQAARIAKLKSEAAIQDRVNKEGKPLTQSDKDRNEQRIKTNSIEYTKFARAVDASNGADFVLMIGESNPIIPLEQAIETMEALAVAIRADEDTLGRTRTQFGELPDFENAKAEAFSGIENTVRGMDIQRLGEALRDAGTELQKPGLSAQDKAETRSIQRAIQVELQRRQEGLPE